MVAPTAAGKILGEENKVKSEIRLEDVSARAVFRQSHAAISDLSFHKTSRGNFRVLFRTTRHTTLTSMTHG